MASSSSCLLLPLSSHRFFSQPRRLLTTTNHTDATCLRLRLRRYSSSSSKIPPPMCSCSSDEDEPIDDTGAADEWAPTGDEDDRYGFEIVVRKLGGEGKRNRRLVRARVRVDAPLEAVWATLTDYEGLASFIPSLAECRLLDQDGHFARLYQVGQQDLALGLKFNAKGVIDCYEGEMEVLPAGGGRRREIVFKMIDGDFKVFEGKWSVEEVEGSIDEGGEISVEQEFQTTLSYLVELEPKLWVPVRLLEGRICNEIKNNLISMREQAQRIQILEDEVIATIELLNYSTKD